MIAFLADEARRPTAVPARPELTEASFGFEDDPRRRRRCSSRAAASTGRSTASTSGPAGEALVQDYKSGAKVDGGKGMLERGQAPAPALHARRARALGARAGRRPLPAARRRPREREPKGLLRKELKEDLAPLDPRPSDHLDDEDFEQALDDARGEGRGDHRRDPRRATSAGDPIDGSCPDCCTLPADLPPRARACPRRSREPEDERRGVTRTSDPDRAAARGDRPAATATSSCAPAPAPARPRCWWTASAPRRSTPRSGVERILAFTFTERAADQLRRRVREALAERAAEAEGERAGALREAERARPTAPGSRRSTASAGGCSPRTRPRPGSTPASGSSTRPRPTGSPRAPSTPRSRSWSQAASAEALELAAANRRRTLLEMTRGAYDELRSHGDPAPELPAAARPSTTRAALAELVEAATAAHEECAEASGQSAAEPRADRRGGRARPGRAADGELLDRLAGAEDHVQGEGASRARPASATREALKRRAQRGRRRRCWRRPTSSCASWSRLRRPLRGAEGGALGARLRGPAAAGASSCCARIERLRERYREQFRHLMVDEFQDTNGLQLGLIEQLRGPGHAAVHGRRRVPVDLRLPPRRRRRLPPRAAPLRRGRGAERRWRCR